MMQVDCTWRRQNGQSIDVRVIALSGDSGRLTDFQYETDPECGVQSHEMRTGSPWEREEKRLHPRFTTVLPTWRRVAEKRYSGSRFTASPGVGEPEAKDPSEYRKSVSRPESPDSGNALCRYRVVARPTGPVLVHSRSDLRPRAGHDTIA